MAGAGGRIDRLDVTRGVAVLGILFMNALAFTYPYPAYFRADAAGVTSPLDLGIGLLGEVLVDQKMMGLFALLFGASLALFTERARAAGRSAIRLALWRNLLLAVIGAVHLHFWDGDILLLYAACAPVALLLRRLPVPGLYWAAGLFLVTPVDQALRLQLSDPAGLGWYWVSETEPAAAVQTWLVVDGFCRALGMMLLGIALYRTGMLAGAWSRQQYRRLAWGGLSIGLPFAAMGAWLQFHSDFSVDSALRSAVWNSIGTVPMTLGYAAFIFGWQPRGLGLRLRAALAATGQMALTNYLTQTVLGLTLLAWLGGQPGFGRLQLLGVLLVIWIGQLLFSTLWLRRFRQGPLEWLWRLATYLRWQPILR